MTDIVERLRAADKEFGESSAVTYGEAADEIERLTAALTRALDRLDTIDKALANVADTWARISALRVRGL